jgi:zinc transport system permease protein
VGVAVLSVVLGLYTSFVFDVAPGGTIVLIAAAILTVVLIVKGFEGKLT